MKQVTANNMMHQWSYVVIPVSKEFEPQEFAHKVRPLFVAHCKICATFFSRFVPYTDYGPTVTPSDLPKFGCIVPDIPFNA